MPEERFDFGSFRQQRGRVELPSPPGDADGLVGDALQIAAHFHGRDHLAQVRGHRMEPQHGFDPVPIHLNFEGVDLLVVGDHRVAPVLIPFEEALAGVFQIADG